MGFLDPSGFFYFKNGNLALAIKILVEEPVPLKGTGSSKRPYQTCFGLEC